MQYKQLKNRLLHLRQLPCEGAQGKFVDFDSPYYTPGDRILSHVSGEDPIAPIPTYDGSELEAVDILADPRQDVFDIAAKIRDSRDSGHSTNDLVDKFSKLESGKDIDSFDPSTNQKQSEGGGA